MLESSTEIILTNEIYTHALESSNSFLVLRAPWQLRLAVDSAVILFRLQQKHYINFQHNKILKTSRKFPKGQPQARECFATSRAIRMDHRFVFIF